MARRPKPWFWKARDGWYVTIGGTRHPLGQDKEEAYDRFYALMRQPQQRKVPGDSLAAIIDAFLEWVSKNRSPDTYEWYRYRLQRFIKHVRIFERRNSAHTTFRPGSIRTTSRSLPDATTSEVSNAA